jgi:hypothetical protein
MRWTWVSSAWLSALIAVVYMIVCVSQLQQSQLSLSEAEARRTSLERQISEYLNLVGMQQNTLHNTKPSDDVESRIAEAIEFARITPKPRFRATVQADRDAQRSRRTSSSQSSNLREQSVTIQIPNLTVEQIGLLLTYWRDRQSVWIPTWIELTHGQRSNTNTYSLHLECVAVYHAQGD